VGRTRLDINGWGEARLPTLTHPESCLSPTQRRFAHMRRASVHRQPTLPVLPAATPHPWEAFAWPPPGGWRRKKKKTPVACDAFPSGVRCGRWWCSPHRVPGALPGGRAAKRARGCAGSGRLRVRSRVQPRAARPWSHRQCWPWHAGALRRSWRAAGRRCAGR
jgi:hypothetical protein